MPTPEEIRARLRAETDAKYRDFNASLLPTVDKERIIGVRTPVLRAYAKELAKEPDIGIFLSDLPHKYFEENQLHAFLIESVRDFDGCIAALERFLPYVDNWGTCDQMAPKVLKKDLPRLSEQIDRWMTADHPYTVRYAIGLRMRFFLEEAFLPRYPEAIARLNREEYYIQMMQAWYFATALAKQPEAILPYFTEGRLSPTVGKMAVRKAIESFRIPKEQKQILRNLSI